MHNYVRCIITVSCSLIWICVHTSVHNMHANRLAHTLSVAYVSVFIVLCLHIIFFPAE